VINYYQGARTNSEVFKQLFCKELLFVYSDCPYGCTKQDSWSQHNYILYIVSGKKNLHTANRSWILTKGTAVFVKKGACIIEKADEEVLCLMAFFIPDNYLRSFLIENAGLLTGSKNNTLENNMVLPLEVNEMMLAYFESVIPYFFSPVKPPENLLELKFRELLFNVIGNSSNEELNSFMHTIVSPHANNIKPVIEANYCYNLKLSEYASLCNRSLSSFKRDFYSLYGTAPARWLLEKRLSHALNLLCNSDNPIIDISFKSGFENSTHFSHAFKKHFGVSPIKYRQKSSSIGRS
jgi:AraC family transcriptional regulator, exoenzyme S synthesis regulatory protein ExsA